MKDQLIQLENQRDSLRAKLKAKSKKMDFGKEWNDLHDMLGHLDGLFSRLCEKHDVKLGAFGRIA